MREVAAVFEVQTHEHIAGLQNRRKHGCVGLRARVGLHIGILGTEELADAVDGNLLHLIDHLATAVIALAGIALGILVGQPRTHGLHDLVAHEILTGNQLHAFQLALVFLLD